MGRHSLLVRFASSLGVGLEALAAASGVPVAQLREPSLSELHAASVWAALETTTGDPAIGLRFGKRFRADEMGPVGTAFMHAADVRAGLTVLVKLLPVFMQNETGELVDVETGGGIRYRTTLRLTQHGTVSLFAASVAMMRDATASHVVPTRVAIPAAHGRSHEACTAFFGVAPSWNASAAALMFSAADLARPFRGASPAVSGMLASHAAMLLARDRGTSPLLAQIESMFWRAHRNEGASLSTVAARLEVSTRTLQRRLSSLDLSFNGLRERLYKGRAHDLLGMPSVAIEAIADELGYASRANFERAFVRWFGKSPATVRRALVVASSD